MSDSAKELLDRVRAVAALIPLARRPDWAILISPEDGVRSLRRGELAERLRSAGLEREAREAMRRGRGDPHSLLCWAECGESADDGAAGFHVLRFT